MIHGPLRGLRPDLSSDVAHTVVRTLREADDDTHGRETKADILHVGILVSGVVCLSLVVGWPETWEDVFEWVVGVPALGTASMLVGMIPVLWYRGDGQYVLRRRPAACALLAASLLAFLLAAAPLGLASTWWEVLLVAAAVVWWSEPMWYRARRAAKGDRPG